MSKRTGSNDIQEAKQSGDRGGFEPEVVTSRTSTAQVKALEHNGNIAHAPESESSSASMHKITAGEKVDSTWSDVSWKELILATLSNNMTNDTELQLEDVGGGRKRKAKSPSGAQKKHKRVRFSLDAGQPGSVFKPTEGMSKSKPAETKPARKITLLNTAPKEPDIARVNLDTLPHSIQAKVRTMQHFIARIDPQAGISYSSIDEDGFGDPTKVRLPDRDFIAALMIVAQDFSIRHPDSVDEIDAEEMAIFEESKLTQSPYKTRWAVINFTKTNEIERKARAVVHGLGFEDRSLLGIECCMQTWQRALRVAAGVPALLFRPEIYESEASSNDTAWSEAQQQGQLEQQAVMQTVRTRPSTSSRPVDGNTSTLEPLQSVMGD